MQKSSVVSALLLLLIPTAVNSQATECSCTCTTTAGNEATTVSVPATTVESSDATAASETSAGTDKTEHTSAGPETSDSTPGTSETRTTTVDSTTVKSSTVKAPNCNQIGELIEVSSSNTTQLTTALNSAIATWNTTDKNNFKGYNKRIQTIIWTEEDETDQSKEEQIAQVVSGFAQDVDQLRMVYEIQIGSWGTVGDFVHCVNELYSTDYQEFDT